MFNSELRNIYSGFVCDALEEVSDKFERLGKRAELIGVRSVSNDIIGPILLVCDYDWEREDNLAEIVGECN